MGTRHSPRPHWGAGVSQQLGRYRRGGIVDVYLAVIARSTCDEAIHSLLACSMDCFASLAMTGSMTPAMTGMTTPSQ